MARFGPTTGTRRALRHQRCGASTETEQPGEEAALLLLSTAGGKRYLPRLRYYRYVGEVGEDGGDVRNRAGTCAGKHAVVAEDLASCGLIANPMFVVGPLVPDLWPDLQELAGHLHEVHECLSVETPWAGPLLVDITWHPQAIAGGLPGTLDWDGASNMELAVQPLQSYAVGRTHLRAQKEALRARLYSPEDRALRDATMTELARRAASIGFRPL